MLYTYFTAMKNSRGITPAYILRKTPDPSRIIIDGEQEIIKRSPLHGNMFSCDTKKVLAVLKELTVDTDCETWMKVKCCGWEAMLAWQNHYNVKSLVERRKQVAKEDLKRLFYRNGTTFSFEKYVTKMKQILNVIDSYNVPLY